MEVALCSSTVYPSPEISVSSDSLCEDDTLVLTDLSADANLWDWDFGDSALASGQNQTHTYSDTGTYLVELMITTSGGCMMIQTQQVQVFGAPSVVLVNTSSATTGNSDGSADIVIAGGVPPFTILWDDPASQTSLMASSLAVGT